MIDLHTHILPSVDDGAEDLETSLAMGRFAQEKGVTTLCATPHFYEQSQWDEIKRKVDELKRSFREAQIAVELVAGAELMMDMGIMQRQRDQIPTFGDQGAFCLVELPLRQIPMYTDQVLFDLQTKGITPIIAHPERYAAVVEDPNLTLKWLKQGCLVQINAGSILGRFGSKIQQISEIMLTHHMVQFVASDAHGLERRRLNLPEAYDALVDVVGTTAAKDLVEINPGKMLRGDFSPRQSPLEYRKKKRFFFF